MPLPLINKYISSASGCAKDIYYTTDYNACNLFDVGQLFKSLLDTSCIANKSIPILSLKLKNLCFLQNRLERVTKPYSENGCDIVATGVANHFKLPYTPVQSPLALHILWVTGEEVTWVPITREYLIGNELLCLRNYQTEILQHKEN